MCRLPADPVIPPRSENVHLLPYTSPADFWARCYPLYTDLFARSARFLDETAASPERTLILVSAGFDACEHEGAGMQRHGGNVPVRSLRARLQLVPS
jgi:histone deacetylase HOS3